MLDTVFTDDVANLNFKHPEYEYIIPLKQLRRQEAQFPPYMIELD